MVLVLHTTRQSVVVIGKTQGGQTEKTFLVIFPIEKLSFAEKRFANVLKNICPHPRRIFDWTIHDQVSSREIFRGGQPSQRRPQELAPISAEIASTHIDRSQFLKMLGLCRGVRR
jgi:hypothetical protein